MGSMISKLVPLIGLTVLAGCGKPDQPVIQAGPPAKPPVSENVRGELQRHFNESPDVIIVLSEKNGKFDLSIAPGSDQFKIVPASGSGHYASAESSSIVSSFPGLSLIESAYAQTGQCTFSYAVTNAAGQVRTVTVKVC